MPKLLEQARTILALATIAFVSNSPTSIGSYWSPFHLRFILLLIKRGSLLKGRLANDFGVGRPTGHSTRRRIRHFK